MLKFSFLLVITIFVLILSCKKEKYSDKYTPLYSELHPYLFDVGSYWAYGFNSNIDSISVTNFEKQYHNTPIYKYGTSELVANNKHDQFVISYYSTFFDSIYYEILFDYYINKGYYVNNQTEINQGTIIYVSNPPDVSISGNSKFIETIPEMNIAGINYYNVKKMYFSTTSLFYKVPLSEVYFYYVDSIGVIRKTYFKDTTIENWDLIDYSTKLVPYY